MNIPQVAIVGRPNVGKSSLFNWLAGRRLAIVDDVAGVTRDRMTHLLEHGERRFELVDTGGIGINDVDNLSDEIEQQIAIALDIADVILFMVDVRSGLTPLDEQVAQRLRAINKPTLLVANKADHEKLDPQADEFYRLGFADVLPVSTLQNRNQQTVAGRDPATAARLGRRAAGRPGNEGGHRRPPECRARARSSTRWSSPIG